MQHLRLTCSQLWLALLILIVLPEETLSFGLCPVHTFHHSRAGARLYCEVLETASDSSSGTTSYRAPTAEIARRRNFAIISHPDAGKTTLTEKLLLFGGAVQDAGAVKARADQRKATSDWMDIEKQRGISVTSTVLSFEYTPPPVEGEDAQPPQLHEGDAFHLNILDTPGHADFSEDTYRTLAAADNCVMLVDAAKGLEERTRKLFEVCRLRELPVFTFVNKMDRPALSPWELMDQLQKEFGLDSVPVNWPIGSGPEFRGVVDLHNRNVHLFERGDRRSKLSATVVPLEAPELPAELGATLWDTLQEDLEMLQELIPPMDSARVQSGSQTPLFFGSAMTNFGVELFLQRFLAIAEPPAAHTAARAVAGGAAGELEQVRVVPGAEEFSGFVFKLQANLDPKHRDRMAFIRVCSGTFRRGMKVGHSRLKKPIALSTAQALFAQSRETVDEAYPGDVIGIHNPGHFAIGDSIYTGSSRLAFPGIPSFSPEKFSYVRNPEPNMYKKFAKGVAELLDEGAVQLLRDRGDAGNGTPILAAVGQLQFEVVEHRLKNEYGVGSLWEPLGFDRARWVDGGWEAVDAADKAGKLFGVHVAQDRWSRPVLLFRNPWKVTQLEVDAPELQLVPWAMPPAQV